MDLIKATSFQAATGVSNYPATSSPPSRRVLVPSSYPHERVLHSDTELTSPNDLQHTQATSRVTESFPFGGIGAAEGDSAHFDKICTNISTQRAPTPSMSAKTSSVALLRARKTQNGVLSASSLTSISKTNVEKKSGLLSEHPRTEQGDRTGASHTNPANHPHIVAQHSRSKNEGLNSNNGQQDPNLKGVSVTAKAETKNTAKAQSKSEDSDPPEDSSQSFVDYKPTSARQPMKSKKKGGKVIATKVEEPTRKQPRRSTRGNRITDSDAEDENDHLSEQRTAMETEMVQLSEQQRVVDTKHGATQQDPIELSDHRSSSFSGEEDETSRPVPVTTLLGHGKAPYTSNLPDPIQNAGRKSAQKPVVIGFGNRGPLNQGTLLIRTSAQDDEHDHAIAEKPTVSVTPGRVFNSSISLGNSADGQTIYAPKSNTAASAFEALNAFPSKRCAFMLKTSAKPQPQEPLKPLKAKDALHDDVVDIDDAFDLMAANSPGVARDDDHSSPGLPSLYHVTHQNATETMTRARPAVQSRKRHVVEVEANEVPSAKKPRDITRTETRSQSQKDPLPPLAPVQSLQRPDQNAPHNLHRRPERAPPSGTLRRHISQGAQSVDRDGSPIPAGFELQRNSTVLETFSQQVNSSPSGFDNLDCEISLAKTSRLSNGGLKVPSPHQRDILSSNTKEVPASPTRASRMITGADIGHLTSERFVIQEDSIATPADPFTALDVAAVSHEPIRPTGPSAGEQQGGMLDTVLGTITELNDRLKKLEQQQNPIPDSRNAAQQRSSVDVGQQPPVDYSAVIEGAMTNALAGFATRLQGLEGRRSEPIARADDHVGHTDRRQRHADGLDFEIYEDDDDPDRTLVDEDDHPYDERDTTPSLTSDNGTDSSPNHKGRSVNHEPPYLDITMWRLSLKPHQVDLFDELVHISHRLVQHLVTEEEADENMINDFYRGGLALVKQHEEDRRNAYAQDREFVEGERGRLIQHFEQWQGRLEHQERKFMAVLQRMRDGLGNNEEDESLEQQLVDHLNEE